MFLRLEVSLQEKCQGGKRRQSLMVSHREGNPAEHLCLLFVTNVKRGFLFFPLLLNDCHNSVFVHLITDGKIFTSSHIWGWQGVYYFF